MKFIKMHGNGNDFIVIEDFHNNLLKRGEEIAKKLCDRHYGIGGDGLILVSNSKIADIKMDIFNGDGSYASMCGNGIRCFAKYVYNEGICKKDIIKIETGDGIKYAMINVRNGEVTDITINMGMHSFDPKEIPVLCDEEVINKSIVVNGKTYNITSLFMGVPHTVIFGNLEEFDVIEGSYIEKLNLFPKGTNVNFCEVLSKDRIKVKTWERGPGITLACGTGSCASVIVANKVGLVDSRVQVDLPGGTLFIEITPNGTMMTGPAEIVYNGEIDL
ncbi:diaminopimelate epimerase [uncultured Clostridium sp.]|uniref:diaminopimelate epimerase n=1 Tax=uncultured Clostridium sp. TaxID=59620 RepID=UPI0028EFB792|nr:diaminopimelate epimerase [uncultured Clostridium sp.]